MNAAPRFRDYQPHTVQVVPILVRVVWRKYGPRRSREVEETRDYKEEKGKGEMREKTELTGQEEETKKRNVRVSEERQHKLHLKDKHTADLWRQTACAYSQTQLGLLPDHWLLCWHVMVLSPTSSKADWQEKVNTSPC